MNDRRISDMPNLGPLHRALLSPLEMVGPLPLEALEDHAAEATAAPLSWIRNALHYELARCTGLVRITEIEDPSDRVHGTILGFSVRLASFERLSPLSEWIGEMAERHIGGFELPGSVADDRGAYLLGELARDAIRLFRPRLPPHARPPVEWAWRHVWHYRVYHWRTERRAWHVA